MVGAPEGEAKTDAHGTSGEPPHVALWILFAFVMMALALIFSGQCAPDRFTARAYAERELPPDSEPELLAAPEIDDEYLPCADCHEGEPTRRTPRELDEHDEIEFGHGDLWCLDCHTEDDYENLHLSDGSLVAFEESWRLCTRCHAGKLSEWRAGVHGKRTGSWRGPKQYRTCVACHKPHAPSTPSLEPRPRPLRASEIIHHETDQPEDPDAES